MKELKNVTGSKDSARKLIIGKDTVYVHTNIRKYEPEDELMKKGDLYVYDEVQYTKDEYIQLISDENTNTKERLTANEQATADLMMMLGGM